jgi:hypothetical protein
MAGPIHASECYAPLYAGNEDMWAAKARYPGGMAPLLRVHVAGATLPVTIQGQPQTTPKELEDALRFAERQWREQAEREKRGG